jgi:HK97 gp10 family phage protein
VIKFNMKGGEAVHKLLQQLPVEVETKILRNGLSAGARVLRDEARSRVPSKTGALRASIKTSRNTNKTEGQVVAKVRLKGKHSFLGNFIEYGVAAHQIWVRGDKQTLLINGVAIGKQVWHPGIAPQPFMRPALDARGGDAVQVVGEYLTRYLQWGTISAPEVAVDLEDAD